MDLRIQKVSELIRQELGNILRKNFRDEAKYITITNTIVTGDMQSCRITYAALGNRELEESAQRFFKKNFGKIKREVAKNINIKHFPEFKLELDRSLEKGNSVLKILNEME
ncbi:MAG: ribosome-binding factor A [Puniceicoccales bacterium]|jgi:ribosome-binding factor A|nr:ribosome-binding factor A [Puniceicoccales bacterium]